MSGSYKRCNLLILRARHQDPKAIVYHFDLSIQLHMSNAYRTLVQLLLRRVNPRHVLRTPRLNE